MNAAESRRLGELLTSLRNLAGMTQEELACASGLSARAISDLERDRVSRPRRKSLELLAGALRLDPVQTRALIAIARGAPARWPDGPAESTPSVSGPAAGRLRAAPHQLPAITNGFTGRSAELETLSGWIDGAAEARAPGTVLTIAGPAGVGKTALAARWGHQAADRFPDGQIWLNLRGFTPAATPLSPAEATRTMLDALQVPPEQVPVTLDAQTGMYRTLLTGTRTLIVLDNARDASQIRPLLPGSPGCLVLTTSRSKLLGLAATDGARVLNLEVLAASEARQLLAGRLGPERLAAEPEAADELLRICAGLPLALGIAAARAATSPGMRLADLAGHLRDAQTRLDVLDGGDPASSLRAVFFSSCRQLPPDAARMFRLLGLHPGPDISIAAARSLAGAPARQVREALDRLTEAHLLTEHLPGRFTFHDLLRAYAREQAEHGETRTSRRAARSRMLDHYLHTAYAAARLINPQREAIALPRLRPGVRPEHLASHQHALSWLEAEHDVLISAISLADKSGIDPHAWQLPWAMANFLDWHGYWGEWAATQRTALAAATRLGDTAAQAVTRRLLGQACARLGDYERARTHLTECSGLYRQLGDQDGEARVHQTLSWLSGLQGSYHSSLGHTEQALALYRASGNRAGQASALNNSGYAHIQLGDPRQGRANCRQALAIHEELSSLNGQANAWHSIGLAEHHLGNLAGAVECYSCAHGIYDELGRRHPAAGTLTDLGDTLTAAGDPEGARDAWQQALAILDGLHHPDASEVRAKLASTDNHGSLDPASAQST